MAPAANPYETTSSPDDDLLTRTKYKNIIWSHECYNIVRVLEYYSKWFHYNMNIQPDFFAFPNHAMRNTTTDIPTTSRLILQKDSNYYMRNVI